MKKEESQSNIELLRMLAIGGVILLHYNNPLMGGGLLYAQGTNLFILYILESLAACGVDLFIMMTGFFACKRNKVNLWRLIELLAQVILFKEGLYILSTLISGSVFSLKAALYRLLPDNYFVVLYCAVVLVSPFVNKLLESLSDKGFSRLMVLLMLLFSVWPTAVDVLGELRGEPLNGLSTVGLYGSQWGYSFVNFLLMYFWGAFLRRKSEDIRKIGTGKLLIALMLGVILTVSWAKVNDITGYLTERSAWEYCNPILIFEAVLLFALFIRMELGAIKTINRLAEGVFTVFLLHSAFIPSLRVRDFATGNPLLMLGHIAVSVLSVYLICWCVYFCYDNTVNRVLRRISEKVKLSAIRADE